jgi:hypothetical protein
MEIKHELHLDEFHEAGLAIHKVKEIVTGYSFL